MEVPTLWKVNDGRQDFACLFFAAALAIVFGLCGYQMWYLVGGQYDADKAKCEQHGGRYQYFKDTGNICVDKRFFIDMKDK